MKTSLYQNVEYPATRTALIQQNFIQWLYGLKNIFIIIRLLLKTIKSVDRGLFDQITFWIKTSAKKLKKSYLWYNISPKLFIQWREMVINFEWERINHELCCWVYYSHETLPKKAGLRINFENTKLMTNHILNIIQIPKLWQILWWNKQALTNICDTKLK